MTSTRQTLLQKKNIFISCVVPIYNEQDVVTDFVKQLANTLQNLSTRFEIILVDDGSEDASVKKILALPPEFKVKLISLSRNFGKETALTAGLEHAQGEVSIIIDADFQHPLEVLPEFLKYWAEGYDMVYGVRRDRADESFIKRFFTKVFYGLMLRITRIHMPANAGDFRLLDKKVVSAINSFEERGRFMKGLYAWVGFESKAIYFDPEKRAAGKSSWKFSRLTELAVTGITLFSDIPLRAWGLIGAIVSAFSFIYAIYIIAVTLHQGVDLPGFATIVVAIMFFGGIQLLSIGILGEYIARIFNEVKRRPKYLVKEKYGFDE